MKLIKRIEMGKGINGMISCPICKKREILFIEADLRIPLYYAGCNKCKSYTNSYSTEEEAVKAWNKRFI